MEKKKKHIIKIVILIAFFVLLINPQWLWFLPEGTRVAIAQQLKETFGASGVEVDGISINLPRIFSLIAMVALLWFVQTGTDLILTKLRYKNNRSRTVANLAQSMIKYLIVIVGIVWGLSIMGVNTTAVFASLGIVGLIVGFGAQSLIEDIITGIFIIFEGQYNIGDVIILGDFRGTVTKIGVRTTCIEDAGGNIKIVNNSDIRNMQNRSVNLSIAICDVGISYDESIPKVEGIIEKYMPQVKEKYSDIFIETPYFAGVQELATSSVVLRLLAKVKEENIFKAQRILNREIRIIFAQNDIEIPYTQVVVHN